MGEWKEYKIGELGIVVTGKTPSSKFPDEFGRDMPFITPSDYGNYNKWALSAERYLSNNGIEKLRSKVLPTGSLLVTCIGSDMGKVVMNRIPVITNQQINSIILNDRFDSNFIYYKLIDEYETLRMYGEAGTAVPIVNKTDFESISIEIPKDRDEQQSIASILSSLDDKIDLLHRQNKTLEALAETLFRQWFVEEADESWAFDQLESHIEVFRGLSYKGSGLTETGLGLPMHNLNSVYEGGGYKFEGIKFYNGEYKERHLLNPGDIIVTNTEQGHEFKLIGFPAFVPDYFGLKNLFSQHIYRVTLKVKSYLTKEFIYYLLMAPPVREQVVSATNGSTVNMLAIDGLQRPEFRLPPEKLVKKFTENSQKYLEKKNLNYNQIRTLTQMRDTLIPKLMSGEVRVK